MSIAAASSAVARVWSAFAIRPIPCFLVDPLSLAFIPGDALNLKIHGRLAKNLLRAGIKQAAAGS
jgi:hypothetical protein